jgi:hypothetical protein
MSAVSLQSQSTELAAGGHSGGHGPLFYLAVVVIIALVLAGLLFLNRRNK